MNEVLRELLEKGKVTHGGREYTLESSMDPSEGELIGRVFRATQPSCSLEIGLALGVSCLYACDAIAANGRSTRHIVLDPNQLKTWHGIGLANIKQAGYGTMIDFRALGSEIGLPQLLIEGTRIQAAIIDGWHTFDHTLVDFFYTNKMLDVGGIVIIDDTMLPAVAKVADHILTYPAYELFGSSPSGHPFARVRRSLRRYPGLGFWRTRNDLPTAMAFRKVAEDTRKWNWHVAF